MTGVTTVWRYNVLPFFSVCWVQQGQETFSGLNGISAIQRDQQLRATDAYKGGQAALCVQLVAGLCQQRIQRFRCDRIEEVTDLARRGDLMNAENRLRIVPVVVFLHPPLIVQKGRALSKKDRERA
jgi:hypothetical protein